MLCLRAGEKPYRAGHQPFSIRGGPNGPVRESKHRRGAVRPELSHENRDSPRGLKFRNEKRGSPLAVLGLGRPLPPLDQMQPLTLMRLPTLAHTFTFGRGGGGGTYTGGGGGG